MPLSASARPHPSAQSLDLDDGKVVDAETRLPVANITVLGPLPTAAPAHSAPAGANPFAMMQKWSAFRQS